MYCSFLTCILSVLLAVTAPLKEVKAGDSSSSSGDFDWRSFLQNPIEVTSEQKEVTSPSHVAHGDHPAYYKSSKEHESSAKAEKIDTNSKTSNNKKKPYIRKEPRNDRYKKEKENIAKLPPGEQLLKHTSKIDSQRKYRARLKAETGFSTKKAAYEGELFRLHRLGETTAEQAQELKAIRDERKLKRYKSIQNRLAKVQKPNS